MWTAPGPVLGVAGCVAASLLGDGSLYVVLPVVFASRGLTPWHVGLILSANRWVRLFTNDPVARLLGIAPIRTTLSTALVVGGVTSIMYGVTTSVTLLVISRCLWGACWSVIRLAGLLVVTDCVDMGLATEDSIGQTTGISAGLSRVGSALGMALGGVVCDLLGFDVLFILAGMLTCLAAPFSFQCAFGSLPRVSVTAARRLQKRATSTASSSCGAFELSTVRCRLFALAFAASCAGNGMIVSTLGAVLASHSNTDGVSGRTYLDLGIAHFDTASFNGVLLGTRWALEGFGAPFYGRLVDSYGWRTVAPAAFALSAANGCIGWLLLRTAESAGVDASGALLMAVLVIVVIFFFLVSAADLCVKAMGVTWREAPLLVQGNDLGAAVGPVLGYALLQMGLPASSVLAAQSIIHAAAALVAVAMANAEHSPSSSSQSTNGKEGPCMALTEADEADEVAGQCQADEEAAKISTGSKETQKETRNLV